MGARRPVYLRVGLDEDVYQIIKKLEEANDGKPFKGITPAYEAIKRSNSKLSRQKKRPLEDAIDRVLQFRKQELDESDSEADLEEAEPVKPDDDRFLLNRQMTKHWHSESAPPVSNSGEGPVAKKRRLQAEGEERAGGNESSTSAPVLTPAPSNGQVETDALPTEKPKKIQHKKAQKSSRYTVEHPANTQRLAGVSEIYKELLDHARDLLKRPLYIHEVWRQDPGILISGPSGVGKKSLVRSLVSDLEVPMISLTGCLSDPERMERSLSEAIEEAMRLAPCIIFIEDLDLYMSNPGAKSYSDHHQRTLFEYKQQILRIQKEQPKDRPILAIATTSRLADVNPAALKLNLFERTIEMRVPDLEARRDIWKVVTEGMKLAEDIDFVELARITHGFVGADLVNVRTLAQRVARKRIQQNEVSRGQISEDPEEQIPALQDMEISSEIVASTIPDLRRHPVSLNDFQTAIENFTPLLRKHGFTSIPSVTWSQVGALRDVREQLNTSIIGPIKYPEIYQNAGLNRPAGCLIYGPPGCGKTLVAQAIANEAQASFILINGPELLNKYVGESERSVRELFSRARSSAPCILFFDEMDSIVPKRDNGSTESGNRVVNALLTELDGAQGRAGVYVIGTTNRPDMIDQAMLRPGRLSVRLFVDIPTADERVDILKAVYRTNHRDSTPEELASLESVARDPRCDGFSGADLGGLHTKAGESAVGRWFKGQTGGKSKPEISKADWEHALAKTRRSVSNPEEYREKHRDMHESI